MPVRDLADTKLRLMQQFGYPEKGAERVAKKLAALSPALIEAVDQWWDKGTPIAIQAGGKTVSQLKSELGLNDIAAILTLDWISIDPETALAKIAAGVDEIR